jgi:Tfp pilus assembly protein PilV
MTNTIRQKNGFSVAEILIGLLILGFVGYLSFAILLRYTKETQKNIIKKDSIETYSYTFAWQEQFQNLNQASRMILLNNNNSYENLCSNDQPNKCIKDAFAGSLNILNSCDNNVKGKCWHNNGDWFYSKNSPAAENIDSAAGIILSNGTFMIFNTTDTTCPSGICGQIYLDVNGFDKPNTFGNDIFKINILKNSLSAQ